MSRIFLRSTSLSLWAAEVSAKAIKLLYRAVNFTITLLRLIASANFPITPKFSTLIDAQDQRHFEGIMDQLGMNVVERGHIEQLALRPNQTSKWSTNMTIPLTLFSPRRIQFIAELETCQDHPYQPPKIILNTVSRVKARGICAVCRELGERG